MTAPSSVTFSVVIPAYNAANTIDAAIKSVLAQQHQAIEVIVVDDCSSDNTTEKVAQYNTVKLIKHSANKGAAAARNTGWDIATAAYIAFLDADDVWDAQKLSVIAASLPVVNFPDLIYHSVTTNPAYTYTNQDAQLVAVPVGFIRILLSNPIHTPSAVVKRAISLRFDERMRYAEDHDLWLRIAYNSKIYFLDAILAQLGRPVSSSGGLSGHKWQMRKGELRMYAKLYQLSPLFAFLMPMLILYSLVKHLVKVIVK